MAIVESMNIAFDAGSKETNEDLNQLETIPILLVWVLANFQVICCGKDNTHW